MKKLLEIAFIKDDVEEMVNFYWGRSAYLRDPDGHLIELHKPSEE
jgi:catechol 2,3-dioxygenase-like lactoylglutathione lyase family enzyme